VVTAAVGDDGAGALALPAPRCAHAHVASSASRSAPCRNIAAQRAQQECSLPPAGLGLVGTDLAVLRNDPNETLSNNLALT
jgi:hypothetical protein